MSYLFRFKAFDQINDRSKHQDIRGVEKIIHNHHFIYELLWLIFNFTNRNRNPTPMEINGKYLCIKSHSKVECIKGLISDELDIVANV